MFGKNHQVTEKDVLRALSAVIEPELHRDLVTLNMIKDIRIAGQEVGFTIVLTTPACPVKEQLKKQAEDVVMRVPGVTRATAEMTAQVKGSGRLPMAGDLAPQVGTFGHLDAGVVQYRGVEVGAGGDQVLSVTQPGGRVRCSDEQGHSDDLLEERALLIPPVGAVGVALEWTRPAAVLGADGRAHSAQAEPVAAAAVVEDRTPAAGLPGGALSLIHLSEPTRPY